jgi:hypothetical protein
MVLTGKVYDFLKFLAQLLLPALGTLYFTVALIWNLPYAEQINGTCLAIVTFLGVVLKISSNTYEKTAKYDGAMNVTENAEGKKIISLDLEGDPYELDKKSEVTFKVNKA